MFLLQLLNSATGMEAATVHERAWLGTNKTLSTNTSGGPDLAYGWWWATPGPANPYYGETCLWGGEGRPAPSLWLSWMKLVCKAPNLLRSEVP